MDGVGLITLKLAIGEVPPPGDGLEIATAPTSPLASAVAGTVAWSDVELP
ncbi:hypothetical protein GRAN_1248 [Granulicella sibirica]|uniref:Uncharacterized protein n=1 Tax=Granulicella sibirica TaxID=2479048 RepID=A0A4Q0T754_9BACT|nr:hypothetical protein GRAN_1248 [Granulicella sibirica]